MKNHWIDKANSDIANSDIRILQKLAEGEGNLDMYSEWQYSQNEKVVFQPVPSSFITHKMAKLQKHHVLPKCVCGSMGNHVFTDDGEGVLNREDGKRFGTIDYETGIITIPVRYHGDMIVCYEWNWAENCES